MVEGHNSNYLSTAPVKLCSRNRSSYRTVLEHLELNQSHMFVLELLFHNCFLEQIKDISRTFFLF